MQQQVTHLEKKGRQGFTGQFMSLLRRRFTFALEQSELLRTSELSMTLLICKLADEP